MTVAEKLKYQYDAQQSKLMKWINKGDNAETFAVVGAVSVLYRREEYYERAVQWHSTNVDRQGGRVEFLGYLIEHVLQFGPGSYEGLGAVKYHTLETWEKMPTDTRAQQLNEGFVVITPQVSVF